MAWSPFSPVASLAAQIKNSSESRLWGWEVLRAYSKSANAVIANSEQVLRLFCARGTRPSSWNSGTRLILPGSWARSCANPLLTSESQPRTARVVKAAMANRLHRVFILSAPNVAIARIAQCGVHL